MTLQSELKAFCGAIEHAYQQCSVSAIVMSFPHEDA
jgi:hypothetical protein